jgi:GTP-binding protein HflX
LVVAADTVGFIRELPHELVAAFQSTLTEAREATLLLHVVDASDPRRDEHIAQVDAVLAEIGAAEIPHILVYNKIDRLELPPRIDRDVDGQVTAVWISAEKRVGMDLLADAVAERLTRFVRRARIRVPASAGALRSRLYAAKAVRDEHSADDGSMELGVELPDVELLVLARTAGVQILEVEGENMPCAARTAYLQSTAVSGAPGLHATKLR